MSALIALLLMQVAPTEIKMYPNDSEFSVFAMEGECMLSAEYESELKTSILVNQKDGAYFILGQQNWKPVARKRYEFKFEFDDGYYNITAVADDTGNFGGLLSSEFLNSYAKSSGLDISWGKKSIAALKLVGSSRAIDALRLCMDESGIRLPVPPARAVTPPQIKSDPFDLSEPARLRTYLGDSYPIEANGAEGAVKAAVTVSPSGRALACVVLETSGSTILDQAACKALRLSGFNAAKDRAGQPIESVIELPVRFEDPSKTVQPH